MKILYVEIRKNWWEEQPNTLHYLCIINRLYGMGVRCRFNYGWENKSVGIGFATQKLGEDYVDLTICENRCLRK